MNGGRSLYEILQVDLRAEPEVVEAAYRGLARKYHSDVSQAATADERMKELNAAYAVLRDPTQRAAYDREMPGRTAGPSQEQRTASGQNPHPAGPQPPSREPAARPDIHPERIEARSSSFSIALPNAWWPASAAEFAPYAENDPSGLTEAVVLGPVDSDYQATCAIARGGWLYERTFRKDAHKFMDSRANEWRLRPWTGLQRTTVAGSPAYYQSFGYTARGPRPAAMTEVFVRRHDRDRDPKKDNIYWVEFGTSEGTHQIHLATLWHILRSWQWVGARRRGLFGLAALAEKAKRDREEVDARARRV